MTRFGMGRIGDADGGIWQKLMGVAGMAAEKSWCEWQNSASRMAQAHHAWTCLPGPEWFRDEHLILQESVGGRR